MATAAPGPERPRRLELVFGPVAGRTELLHAYADPPFAIRPLFYPANDDRAHFILVQATAGLFGGDALDISIQVRPGARAVVTSQAAQQLHPSVEAGARATQQVRVRVDEGGELHGCFDPLIPFARARLEQQTALDVAGGGRLFWCEGLMAGRVRRGERWQFACLALETALRRDGDLLYLERFVLGEGEADPAAPWAMGRHRYLGSLLACDARLDEARGDALQAALFPPAGETDDAAVRGAVDLPAPGVLVGRVIAVDGASFRRLQHAWRTAAFDVLLQEPAPALRP
ncbi:MAG TPA: urease accessory protein UreD [Vicinamibacterales bacterium]|nr:urease accessory protein UreD [Vicinamibacterales bacterium]